MDYSTLSLIILSFLIGAWFPLVLIRSIRRPSTKLPPRPRPFPIIGNIHQLSRNPHQSLATLSKTYGPLMYLRLGSIHTVVVSSPEIAKQVLQKYDHVFCSRAVPAAAQSHKISMFYLPFGNQYRKLRKICQQQLFWAQRLDSSQGLRREKVHKLCDYVQKCCIDGRAVGVGQVAFLTSLNLKSTTIFSMDVTDFDTDDAHKFKETFDGMVKAISNPNLVDFFSVLRAFDSQGIRRQGEFYFGKMIDLFEGIIKQRLESRGVSTGYRKKSDLLEPLLDLGQGSEYDMSVDEIKHFIFDLFFAGSHTTAGTVEWAMMELLLNPDKMAKAKDELRNIIGENKQVEESDIPRLPYLQALIKETLRYHPAVPLLFRKSEEDDVVINGYTIPKNTQIFVNAWAIGRDSSIWLNPSSFEPERFLDSKIDLKGQDFVLLPFGSGRRICPGMALADRNILLMLASLIHNFDWKLEAGVKLGEVDTSEKFGLSLEKAVPLKAVLVKV